MKSLLFINSSIDINIEYVLTFKTFLSMFTVKQFTWDKIEMNIFYDFHIYMYIFRANINFNGILYVRLTFQKMENSLAHEIYVTWLTCKFIYLHTDERYTYLLGLFITYLVKIDRKGDDNILWHNEIILARLTFWQTQPVFGKYNYSNIISIIALNISNNTRITVVFSHKYQ